MSQKAMDLKGEHAKFKKANIRNYVFIILLISNFTLILSLYQGSFA